MSRDGDAGERLRRQRELDRLSDALSGRDAGGLFSADLEEARTLAASDPRFRPLAEGLESDSLGERMEAIDRFFDGFDPEELGRLELPMHLSQLRTIYLKSRPGEGPGSED